MCTNVGIKSGCFTLLHSGHFWCLELCQSDCNHLIVLTNSDEYIRRKKGNVPINLSDRLYMLRRIRGVAETSFFEQDTEHEWIKNFKENRLYQEFGVDAQLTVFHSDELKGQDWVPGQDIADTIIFVPKVDREESVTKIYKDIKDNK